jgi:hypothetical protein
MRYLLPLPGTSFYIFPTVWTWLQAIFTCSHTLKQFWGSTHMHSDEEVKTVEDWFNGLAADFYNAGIQKLDT